MGADVVKHPAPADRQPPTSSRRPTARSRVADWHWEPVTEDLLDGLPPAALAAVRQVAEELTIRESMIFLDGCNR